MQDFKALDSSDWVLVIDNADLGLPSPGQPGSNPPARCTDEPGAADSKPGSSEDPACPEESNITENTGVSRTNATSAESGSVDLYTLVLLLCAAFHMFRRIDRPDRSMYICRNVYQQACRRCKLRSG